MDKLEDLSVVTEDGIGLPVTHFSGSGTGPVVIISSAVAVPRKIYRHFARHLLEKGASHVYTYDFRGIDGQNLERSKLKSINMMDWAVKDFPAIVDYVRKTHPSCELVGVGHSFGGQVLGMGEMHKFFSRYLGIACGSGYIKYTKHPCSLSIRMRVLSWLSLWFNTKIPKALSLGTEFPTGVFRQWQRWCNSPNYMMSDPAAAAVCQFEQVSIPLRFVGFSDDLYVTPKAFSDLRSWYNKADQTIDWINCETLHRKVGHFGFFKQENDRLWPAQSNWLVNG